MIEAMERKRHGYKIKLGDLEISWTWGEGKGVSKYPAWENGCTILPSAKTENAGGETGQGGEGKGLS